MTTDECNDAVIQGRIGSSNIYEYSDGVLGVMFITDAKKPPKPRTWSNFKARCLKTGMTLRQDGDAEGSFTFDPNNPEQAKTAIKGIRVRIRRILSEKQQAILAAGRRPFPKRG